MCQFIEMHYLISHILSHWFNHNYHDIVILLIMMSLGQESLSLTTITLLVEGLVYPFHSVSIWLISKTLYHDSNDNYNDGCNKHCPRYKA